MTPKKFDPYNVELNEEEKDLLESFERGEWKTVDNPEAEAAFKGLPYQTFIASVLHEYAAGHFTEVT